MKHYKAALIGCGSRAPAHIKAYDTIDNARVTACYAPTPMRREPLAQKFGLTAYGDLDEMLRMEKPDIVHIITTPTLRYGLMKTVSDHGVALCTVEKPIATAVEDWERLLSLEKESATRFGISHQVRWQPNLMKCQEAIRSFGEVKLLDMSCGMNISGQGTHILNYGRSLNGDAKVVSVFAGAHGWDDNDPHHTGPLTSEAYLMFENGVRGMWTSGRVSVRCGDPATTWQHVHVGAVAERGRVDYEEFANWTISGEGRNESGHIGSMEKWTDGNILAQAGFHRAMIEWLVTGREIGTSLAASLHEWQVVLAMYQSVLDCRPVELKDFSPRNTLVSDLETYLRKKAAL